MSSQEIYNEFIKWAFLGLVGWIAIQVTDLKQNMAGLSTSVVAIDSRTNRIADAIVRLMGADTEMSKMESDTAQRVSKLEAKIFK